MKKMLSNLRFLFTDLRQNDPIIFVWELFTMILSVFSPLLATFFSSELIRIVTESVLPIEFFSVIIILSILTIVAKIGQTVINTRLNSHAFALQMRFRLLCLEKQMKMEYIQKIVQ